MKILHTADIHIGVQFKNLGEKGSEQRRQIKDTFVKVIDTAVSEKVDLVLISGDIFDSNIQAQREIDCFVEQLRKLENKDITTFLIGGTHDYLSEKSALRRCKFGEIFKSVYLLDDNMPFVRLSRLDLTVYGFSLPSNKGTKSPVQMLSKEGRSTYNVGMVHGSFDIGKVGKDDWVFTADDIEDSGLNYIACGHWHSYFEVPTKKTKAVYSGSPELIALGESDSGNIVMVNIDGSGKTTFEKKRTGRRSYQKVQFDGEKAFSGDTLAIELAKAADPNLILDVDITGLVSVENKKNIDAVIDELAGKYFRLKINDNTHLKLDSINMADYPETLTAGRFVRIMQTKINSTGSEEQKSLYEASLQLGLALLSGKEILK